MKFFGIFFKIAVCSLKISHILRRIQIFRNYHCGISIELTFLRILKRFVSIESTRNRFWYRHVKNIRNTFVVYCRTFDVPFFICFFGFKFKNVLVIFRFCPVVFSFAKLFVHIFYHRICARKMLFRI